MTYELIAELRQLAHDLQAMPCDRAVKFKHPAMLALAAETIARQQAALNALAKCELNDGSLAVASARVRNVALVGLGLKNEKELHQEESRPRCNLCGDYHTGTCLP